jgi:hypothetical protein
VQSLSLKLPYLSAYTSPWRLDIYVRQYFSATPQYQKPLLDYLINNYNWTMEKISSSEKINDTPLHKKARIAPGFFSTTSYFPINVS